MGSFDWKEAFRERGLISGNGLFFLGNGTFLRLFIMFAPEMMKIHKVINAKLI